MPKIEKKLESDLENLNQPEKIPSSSEQKENIEKKPERITESEVNIEKKPEIDSISDQDNSKLGAQNQVQSPLANRLKKEIDDILEEGLEDIYLNMSTAEQEAFKIKGEETTNKIASLVGEAKIKVKKIVQTIVEWLKMISGVNKFFIKQTAKIKTDKILEAKKNLAKEENQK